jgi:23S rRNA (adenine2503-C2)-methyltransferase
MDAQQPINLKDLSLGQLGKHVGELGEPRFRARQIAKWIYQKRVARFEDMSNMPKTTRAKLAQTFTIEKLRCPVILESREGDAVKFGFTALGKKPYMIESVLLYDGKRRTACLSSQLGCGLGCTFCTTASMGFVRNLSLAEVTGQLIGINDYLAERGDKPLTHIVFMGMGEALSNFEVFASCCEIITSQDCLGLAHRRITVSTVGVVSSIRRLIDQGPPVNLAVSLNTFSDERRSALMPINKTYPIASVVEAARAFIASGKGALTFEYVVIPGENDTPRAVNALTRLLHGIPCKVNCISLNPGPGEIGPGPSPGEVKAFADALHRKGITATVRKSRGRDIQGACGQLSARMNRGT